MNKRDVLEAAINVSTGKRETDYGSAKDNMRRTALLWNAYLDARFPHGCVSINEIDVCQMMTLHKMGRAMHNEGYMDNYVDGAGYQACAGEIAGAKLTLDIPAANVTNDVPEDVVNNLP